jgi:hypothetical protein
MAAATSDMNYLRDMHYISFYDISKNANCKCVYCTAFYQEIERIEIELEEFNDSYYCDCDCNCCHHDYIENYLQRKIINEFIDDINGTEYIPKLNAKINTYIQALFNDTPSDIEKTQYFADDISLGCHVAGYINACFNHIKYRKNFIASNLVSANISIDTIKRITTDFKWETGGRDILYECIRTGNIPYLLEYNKHFKIDFRNIGLNMWISNNSELITDDIITLLIDLADREILDYIMISGLTNTIEQNMSDNANTILQGHSLSYKDLNCYKNILTNMGNIQFTLLKELPEKLEILNCSMNTLTTLDNLPTSLERLSMTRLYMYHDTNQMNSEVESVLKMLNQNAVYKVYSRYCYKINGNSDNLKQVINKFVESREKDNIYFNSLEDIYKHIPMMFNLIIQDIFNN